ncbi:gamma-glutamyl-gamma-aminobutyrate hydrolase family protein [Nitrosopumilus maritimus]|uniref:Peptidase C26 n=1 Tax=Nitrosopumilus maritimus (strain SCM1) TaxID=436308 RepID=A9A3C8_NITMS|nr:gamma-glutamyl-gamma-aminobutyrate hydrolase family protein [Nitrosopumilus maritimus]ABX12557.1 peptidase C26 [Nitrosopumilus maritimus SCM1]
MVKKIGITLRIETIQEYDEKRDALSHDWFDFFQKLNCLPVLIPNKLREVESFLEEMDLNGLILSGGDNIGDDPERDKTEKKIMTFAMTNNIPLLGVCRGMQVINQFFNGKIIFDNSNIHVGKNHVVDIIDTKFSNFLQTNTMNVNSFHHNLIDKSSLGKNLIPFAFSSIDQTIEGFYHENSPILGVMWHPERVNLNSNQTELVNMLYCDKIW